MWNLVWSPSRFLTRRLEGRPGWPSALAAPALCGACQSAAALVVVGKTGPAVDALLTDRFATRALPYRTLAATAVGLGYPLLFGVIVLAALALNVLARRPGPASRLTELTAVAFYTQVPYCLLMLALTWAWQPPAPEPYTGQSTMEMLSAMQTYRDTALAGPLPSTARLLSIYSLGWLAAVVTIALRLVARLSTRDTAAVAVFLCLLCTGAPVGYWLLELLG